MVSTSCALPMWMGDLWWMCWSLCPGCAARRPTSAPPAFSMTYAMGKHSYRSRSFPSGLFASRGYENVPPYSSVRCTSATMLPMYRRLRGGSSTVFTCSTYALTPGSQNLELPSLTE